MFNATKTKGTQVVEFPFLIGKVLTSITGEPISLVSKVSIPYR